MCEIVNPTTIPLFEGSQVSCYRTNGRGGKRLLITAGGCQFTLEELKVLGLTCSGKTVRDINEKRGVSGAHNMRWRLRQRNNGMRLAELYEVALKQELLHPFVIAGLDNLLRAS